MKHLNENNKKKGILKFMKFKDMENWDPKQNEDKEKLTGKKKLNTNLGQKVIEFFEENLLFVSVGPGDWIKRQELLLPDEKKLKEYRVTIGRKNTYEEWLEWNGYDDSPEKEKEWEEETPDFEDRDCPEWSVFLPVGTKNLEGAAMADSSTYLKLITDAYPKVVEYHIDTRHGGALGDDPDGFKKFINKKGVNITNDNVEIVNKINTRLYKDSKVFGEFREILGDYETKEFMKEWLKLM